MAQVTYEVRVSGVIPPDVLPDLQGMAVTIEPPETVLHGPLPDQSAVVGLIARIHVLGLRLIEVRRLPDELTDPLARP